MIWAEELDSWEQAMWKANARAVTTGRRHAVHRWAGGPEWCVHEVRDANGNGVPVR